MIFSHVARCPCRPPRLASHSRAPPSHAGPLAPGPACTCPRARAWAPAPQGGRLRAGGSVADRIEQACGWFASGGYGHQYPFLFPGHRSITSTPLSLSRSAIAPRWQNLTSFSKHIKDTFFFWPIDFILSRQSIFVSISCL
jgi:hypothetical protein